MADGRVAFEHLQACSDLSERDLVAAMASQDACSALLLRFAEVSRPRSGAAAILALFAHLGSGECPWREGDLAVELTAEEGETRVRVMQELGGLRERILPTVYVHAPLSEITVAVARFPALLAALHAAPVSRSCLWLLSGDGADVIPELEIDERSISGFPGPVPHEDVDGSWDEILTA